MSCEPEAAARYERWRSQWLTGTDTQTLATFRWHGLAATLALTASRSAAARTGRCPAPAAAVAGAPAAIAEAARQICALLRPQEDTSHA